jgi:hypothetical protein
MITTPGRNPSIGSPTQTESSLPSDGGTKRLFDPQEEAHNDCTHLYNRCRRGRRFGALYQLAAHRLPSALAELWPKVGEGVNLGKAAYREGVGASTSPPKERYAVSNGNVVKLIQPGILTDRVSEVLRDGARALLTQAVEPEVSEFLAATADLKTDDSCRRVVRHGHLLERQIMTDTVL